MPSGYNNTSGPSLVAAVTLAVLALAATSSVHAVMIDLRGLYADPTVTVSADGTTARIDEDPGTNPVVLSSFDLTTLAVRPGALYAITNPGQQFNFTFNFVEPAGNDEVFFVNLLNDTGFFLQDVFSTDATSTASVSVNLDAYIGNTIGIEFGLDQFDATLASFVELSAVEITAGNVVAVPEPATVLWLILGLGALPWLRARHVRRV